MTGDRPRLPEHVYQDTVGDLKLGATGWTVPWALVADEEGDLYLLTGHSIHSSPGGTVQMFVQRLEGGFLVDIRECGFYRWPRGEQHRPAAGAERVIELLATTP